MERKASTARSHLEQVLVDEATQPQALPLSLLEDITSDFSDDQEIGRGGFAVVYKGIIGDRAVAVKRLSNAFMDDKEFHREVQCLMRVKHKNVVRFLGYCADRQGSMATYNGKLVMADVHQRLLCFEYIPKGSLDKYIIDSYRDWRTCYKIIKGICEGLQFLHENHIIHLDLKPANILLDDGMVPKITDFGLSRLFEENQSRDITKTILGTMGYLAPEFREGGVITLSADLYSLGVIIIEILTGQKGYQAIGDVLESWSDRLERSQRDALSEQIRVCYEIGLECRDFNPKKRPGSARDIIDRLHEMESVETAEATSSTSGVAHPLEGQTVVTPHPTGPAEAGAAGPYHGPRDDHQDAFAAASSDPVVSTSRAPATESKGKSKVEPRVFRSVSASSEPRHGMPQAMAPGQTVAAPGSQYSLTETKPPLPAKMRPRTGTAKIAFTYDMVEPMTYLYVSVVKARDLPTMDITGALDPYVEVKLGNFKGVTRHQEKTHNPVWRQTFAFSGAHLQASQLEVIVMDKDTLHDDFVGRVVFDMSDIPLRFPPGSPLAPQWYSLSDAHGERFQHGHARGEIMLAVWFGTQADEAFPEAWHSEAHSLSKEELTNTRSKEYYSPKLIYLKVSVIAAQDLIGSEKDRPLAPTIAKIQMGSQIRHTRPGQPQGSANPVWNEEFMFVAIEPFEDPLVVTVEEKVAADHDEPISHVIIPVASPYVPRNDLAKWVPSKWVSLETSRGMTVDEVAADVTTESKHWEQSKTFASKIHLKVSLETAYHVLDESMDYISDLQPAAKKLRKSAIGMLEVGILTARGLGGNKNPFCVAKYGAKWVRTRTLFGTAAPAWNEQYTWEVFDLSTVITVAVLNNNNNNHGHGDGASKDQRIGKVRVRLATLESDRVYTHYYPLMELSPGGLKKTGELHLAVRFTCTAWANMLAQYGRPLLPKMHYTNPISLVQLDYLQYQATQMVATRLCRAEPPLRREVVEYILDPGSHMFSLRRSKANFRRITTLFSGVVAVAKWLNGICKWKNPLTTILVHVGFLKLVCYPELILPTVFLCMIMIMAWNYRRRPRGPPHIDTVLSRVELANTDELDKESDKLQPPHIDTILWWYTDLAYPDELDEEFDTSATSKPDDIVRLRYDRLRSLAEMVQTVAGDLAAQGERAQSLLRWHDPKLTPVFIALSLVMAVVLYLTPFRVLTIVVGLYFLRPPWFRGRTNLLLNLYSRLPSKDDVML